MAAAIMVCLPFNIRKFNLTKSPIKMHITVKIFDNWLFSFKTFSSFYKRLLVFWLPKKHH